MTLFSGAISRSLRIAAIAAGLLGIVSAAAHAQDSEWRHGLSLFGKLKYPADFSHYDYANPDAPKGGALRRGTIGTFDTLNPFNIKGNPAAISTIIGGAGGYALARFPFGRGRFSNNQIAFSF